MKARFALIVFFLPILTGCYSRTTESTSMEKATDSLLVVLDNEIRLKTEFEKYKREVIDSLKQEAASPLSDSCRFDVWRNLFLQYRSYAMDTLVTIARMCRAAASSLGSDSLLWQSMLMEAEAYKGIGRYDESLAVLDSLPPAAVGMYHQDVLNRYTSVYYSLYENTYPRSDAERYREKLVAYRDSLIRISPEGSFNRKINTAELCRVNGEPELAIKILGGGGGGYTLP